MPLLLLLLLFRLGLVTAGAHVNHVHLRSCDSSVVLRCQLHNTKVTWLNVTEGFSIIAHGQTLRLRAADGYAGGKYLCVNKGDSQRHEFFNVSELPEANSVHKHAMSKNLQLQCHKGEGDTVSYRWYKYNEVANQFLPIPTEQSIQINWGGLAEKYKAKTFYRCITSSLNNLRCADHIVVRPQNSSTRHMPDVNSVQHVLRPQNSSIRYKIMQSVNNAEACRPRIAYGGEKIILQGPQEVTGEVLWYFRRVDESEYLPIIRQFELTESKPSLEISKFRQFHSGYYRLDAPHRSWYTLLLYRRSYNEKCTRDHTKVEPSFEMYTRHRHGKEEPMRIACDGPTQYTLQDFRVRVTPPGREAVELPVPGKWRDFKVVPAVGHNRPYVLIYVPDDRRLHNWIVECELNCHIRGQYLNMLDNELPVLREVDYDSNSTSAR